MFSLFCLSSSVGPQDAVGPGDTFLQEEGEGEAECPVEVVGVHDYGDAVCPLHPTGVYGRHS